MAGTQLPPPPVRLGVSVKTLACNVQLRDDLRCAAIDAQHHNAAVWILAITQVLDKHGYRLEIFKD